MAFYLLPRLGRLQKARLQSRIWEEPFAAGSATELMATTSQKAFKLFFLKMMPTSNLGSVHEVAAAEIHLFCDPTSPNKHFTQGWSSARLQATPQRWALGIAARMQPVNSHLAASLLRTVAGITCKTDRDLQPAAAPTENRGTCITA